MLVREHGLRMEAGGVLPLLDIDGVVRRTRSPRPCRAWRRRDCGAPRRRESRFPAAESGNGGSAPWRCRRPSPTKTRPESPARSSSKSSAERSASRKYSHHTAFSSRRCQSRMLAKIQRACCSSFRSAGSAGTSAVSLSISALILISQSVIFSFGAPSPGCGRGTSDAVSDQAWPAAFRASRARLSGGAAIILVVGAHCGLGLVGDRRSIVEFEIRLEIGECDIRIGERHLALECRRTAPAA